MLINKLLKVLLDNKIIFHTQMHNIANDFVDSSLSLRDFLLHENILSDLQYARYMGQVLDIKYVDLDEVEFEQDIINVLAEKYARENE